MSGRIRSIKPEILGDDITANLSHLEWRLFVSLWLVADDYGNLRGEPNYIRGVALWAAKHNTDNVSAALKALIDCGLIVEYVVRGQVYMHISGWSKHQRVDKPGKPHMPGPEDHHVESLSGVTKSSRIPRETVAESPQESRESLTPDLRPTTNDLDLSESADSETLVPPVRSGRKGKALAAGRADGPPTRRVSLALDWKPSATEANAEAEATATNRGITVPLELEKIRDWAVANAVKKANWDATWRNWLRNAKAGYGQSGRSGTDRVGASPRKLQEL